MYRLIAILILSMCMSGCSLRHHPPARTGYHPPNFPIEVNLSHETSVLSEDGEWTNSTHSNTPIWGRLSDDKSQLFVGLGVDYHKWNYMSFYERYDNGSVESFGWCDIAEEEFDKDTLLAVFPVHKYRR